MQVKDLKPRQGNVDITLEVIEVGETREFQKFGNTGRVANVIGKDSTGQVKVSLWNDDIDKVKEGDHIKITNGWVSEFQGEKQLSAGRLGKLEVVGKEDAGEAASTKKGKKKPKEEEEIEEDEDMD